MKKYSFEKREFQPYDTPREKGWNCHFWLEPEELINCAECGKELKIGECRRSLLIRTEVGNYRYAVCPECSRKEMEERRRHE